MKRTFTPDHMGCFLRYALILLLPFPGLSLNAQTVLNNNLLRFGNGTENSVNGTGNVQQPFYYSTQFNSWRQLTYANYSLNQSFAFGGDGTNDWNTNGTLVNNPMLSDQVFDLSDFNYANGTSGPGNGTIVSTGTVTINGMSIQLENTYILGTSSFITIKTKITNTSDQQLTNLRYWVGTQDDYVGGTDSPIKERGNLVDGAFQTISAAADQSQAIRIKTAEEGVLFFSTSVRTRTMVNTCCMWSNILYQDPATSVFVTPATDGSYGMYIRMDDLAPGQSDTFTWYYAAANLTDLDGVVDEVSQAAGGLGNTTCNSAIFEVKSTVPGTGYLITVPDGSAAPAEAQIKAGLAYDGVSPVFATSIAMNADVEYDINISGLNPATTYQTYYVFEDETDTFSAIVHKHLTTMDNPAIAFAKTDASCADAQDGQLVATASNGTEPFNYLWTGGPAVDTYSSLNPGPYEVSVVDANNCQATAADTIGIHDTIPPVAAAHNINVYLNAEGHASLSADALDNGSADNCQIADKAINLSSFSCENLNENVNVTLTVTDAAGNTHNAIGVVTVVDTIKPLIDVKPLVVQLNVQGIGMANPEDANNGSADNCAIASMSLSKTIFTCADLGVSQVIFSATDASGNTRSMPVQVTVVDNVAPTMAVQNVMLEIDENGSAILDPAAALVFAHDNCTLAEYSLSKSVFGCSDLGVNVVTLTVSDLSGNTTSATFDVTVTDQMAPVFNAPALIEMCEGKYMRKNISASDNCHVVVTMTDGPQNGKYLTAGDYLLTYEAMDPSGNTASITVPLLVHPNPVVNLGEDLTVPAGSTVTLMAGLDKTATYEWSTGQTGPSIEVVVNEEMTISVAVTSAARCTESDEIHIQVDRVLGLADAGDDFQFMLFPNPTAGMLSIRFEGAQPMENVHVAVIDMNGREVLSERFGTLLNQQVVELNTHHLTNGVYLVRLQSEAFNLTHKMIKQ